MGSKFDRNFIIWHQYEYSAMKNAWKISLVLKVAQLFPNFFELINFLTKLDC